jgi:hypothetical protein
VSMSEQVFGEDAVWADCRLVGEDSEENIEGEHHKTRCTCTDTREICHSSSQELVLLCYQ